MNEAQIKDHGERITLQFCSYQNPCWPMIGYGIFLLILTIGGILSNFSVIFVTIRTKSFRGSVNILLAFYSLFEIINFCGNFLSIFTAFSGQYFMPFNVGIYFGIIPLTSIGCSLLIMLFIGIERLFVVLFPLKKFNSSLFLTVVLMVTVIQIIVPAFVYWSYYDDKLNALDVVGNYYDIIIHIFDSEFCLIVLLEGIIMMVSTVIVYALIALTIQCRKAPSNSNAAQFNKRIFCSLLSIVLVNFGGYIIAMFSIIIQKSINSDSTATFLWNFNQIIGILLHFSAASCGPILFLTSSEYRTAFQKEFSILFKLICANSSSAVAPQQ